MIGGATIHPVSCAWALRGGARLDVVQAADEACSPHVRSPEASPPCGHTVIFMEGESHRGGNLNELRTEETVELGVTDWQLQWVDGKSQLL